MFKKKSIMPFPNTLGKIKQLWNASSTSLAREGWENLGGARTDRIRRLHELQKHMRDLNQRNHFEGLIPDQIIQFIKTIRKDVLSRFFKLFDDRPPL